MFLNKRIAPILIAVVFILTWFSCKHPSPEPVAPNISFKENVLPLIIGNCSAIGCHPAVGGEFSLATYNDVITNGKIIAGNSEKSILVQRIKDTGVNRMPKPPDNPLTQDQIKIIELWVNQGAFDN